jgi:hypothetical protein
MCHLHPLGEPLPLVLDIPDDVKTGTDVLDFTPHATVNAFGAVISAGVQARQASSHSCFARSSATSAKTCDAPARVPDSLLRVQLAVEDLELHLPSG